MTGLDFKLIIIADEAFLAYEHPISFAQLGLPGWVVPFYTPAYWIIHIISYNEAEQSMFAEIKSYQSGNSDFDSHQIAYEEELKKIQRIKFRGLNTVGLNKTMNYNRPIKMPVLKENEIYIDHLQIDEKAESLENLISGPIKKQDKPIAIKQTFQVPFKNLSFVFGGVQFKKYFTNIDKEIELTIANYDCREEFDAVKNYFSNILHTKKITVFLDAVYQDEALKINHMDSPQIRQINKSLIDQVKFEFVRGMHKRKLPEVDKSLFTMEEYFDTLTGEQFKSNTFYSNEKDLLDDLLQISDTKHYKNLRYLSDIHAHHIMKLRFVIKPFSFIFLIAGEKKYHIVWETLDSEEATYVWHVDKDLKILKTTLQKIEDIINVIKVQGKIAYINTSEDPFRRVFHDYSDLKDGFIKWKAELESILY